MITLILSGPRSQKRYLNPILPTCTFCALWNFKKKKINFSKNIFGKKIVLNIKLSNLV